MRKCSAMLAATALLVSSGIASAQSQSHASNDNSGLGDLWTENHS